MRILMIEDQVMFAEMMVHLLEGLHVEVVETLAEAKTRLHQECYDMILVDLGLPDSYGMETLRALGEFKIPKVVLTARHDIDGEATKLGAIDYILKTNVKDADLMYERIMFNVSKAQRTRKQRLAPAVFQQIRACFEREHAEVPELTHA